MWAIAIGVISLTVVLIAVISLYIQQERVKEDLTKKLNSVVTQINDSQFYEYSFDKNQDQNIQNMDKNTTVLYDSVTAAQKNLKYLELTAVKKDDLNNKLNTKNIKTGVLQLGDKFTMSGVGDAHGNDDWLRVFDKSGADYYGGIATKKIWTRDNAYLNGTTNITGNLTATGLNTFKGGKSDKNPDNQATYLPNIDGKNYIRGDTEVKGHIDNVGSLRTDRIKAGHNLQDDWVNNSSLTALTTAGKAGASFGGEKYWSHFPWADGNTYIRPGTDGKGIKIGDIGAPYVQIRDSWFPYVDGNTYIRPGQDGKDINIGDWGAANVNIGRGDTNINLNGKIVFNPDSTDPYTIEKRINGFNQSSLRVTINDDADETFEIWGDGCRAGNCRGDGKPRMSVRADGRTQINGNLVICDTNGGNCRNV